MSSNDLNVYVGQQPAEGQLAAEYVRMSTEHQRYSIGYQRAAIAEYASRHVIETYTDEGMGQRHPTSTPNEWRLQEVSMHDRKRLPMTELRVVKYRIIR